MGINVPFTDVKFSQILSPIKMLPHFNCDYSLLFKSCGAFGISLNTSKVASLGPRLSLQKGSLSLHSPKNQSFAQRKPGQPPPPLPLFSSAGQVCGRVTSEQMAVVPDDGISYVSQKINCLCVHTMYLAPFVYI